MAANKENKFIIYIGTFNGNDNTFSWDADQTFDKFNDAYKAFKNLITKCATYSYDELRDIYGSPRLDVELRYGDRNLKWFGIHEKDFDEAIMEE